MASITYKISGKHDDKGIEDAKKGLASLGEGVEKLNKLFKGFIALEAVKKVSEIYKDTSEAFTVQQQSWTTLSTAISNNANATAGSFKRMLEYTSELQSKSIFGDEALQQQAAFLETLNLTEDQIKNVLKVAVDISSQGVMPLDGAVKNLARTYGGLAGELGEKIPALKNLTVEQMKAGEAIELVGKNFRGMGEAVASTLGGTRTQVNNIIGDIKEKIGAIFGAGESALLKEIKPILSEIDTWLGENQGKILAFFKHIPEVAKITFEALKVGFSYTFSFENIADRFKAAMQYVGKVVELTLQAIVTLIAEIAMVIWTPFQVAFEHVIYSIELAFVKTINGMITSLNSLTSMLPGGNLLQLGKIAEPKAPTDTVGGKLEAVFTKFGNAFKDMGVDFLKASIDMGTSFARDLGDKMNPYMKQIDDYLESVKENTDVVAQALQTTSNSTPQLDHLDMIQFYGNDYKPNANTGSGMGPAPTSWMQSGLMNGLSGVLDTLKSAFSSGGMDMAGMFGQLTQAIGPLISAIGPLAQGIQGFIAGLGPWGLLLIAIIEIAKGFIGVVGPAINGVIGPLMRALQGVGKAFGEAILPVLDALAPVFAILGDIITRAVAPALQFLAPVFSLLAWILQTIVVPIIKAISVAFEILMSPVKFMADLFTWVGAVIQTFGYNVGEVVSKLLHPWDIHLQSGPGAFSSDAFSGLGDRIADIWNANYSTTSASSTVGTSGSSATYTGANTSNYYFYFDGAYFNTSDDDAAINTWNKLISLSKTGRVNLSAT